MRIILDFDHTIAASSEAIHQIYKEETKNVDVAYNKNHSWDFAGLVDESYYSRAKELFCEKKFFDILNPIDNSLEVIKLLSTTNEIFIVTNHKAKGIYYKDQWIRNNIPTAKVVYLDTFDKSIVCGDIFIDDKIECLNSASKNFTHIFCFGEYTWNEDWNGKRLRNWHEVLTELSLITNT